MFADAWEEAARHTRHVVTCARYADGALRAGGATFFVLNASGWVATAGHVFDPPGGRARAPVRCERWWGADGVAEAEVHVYEDVDLALCRLEPPPAIEGRPRLRPPETQRLGSGLLTLGYPYEPCRVDFDEARDAFEFEGATRGLYGVEGMLARIIDGGAGDGYERRFLESSAVPRVGLSGGPAVAADGTVWGIQVRAHHEPLGYEVRVDRGARSVVEHQVGTTSVAVQTGTLRALLDRHGVEVEWAA